MFLNNEGGIYFDYYKLIKMKVFCSQKDLEMALNITGKAISTHNTLPVLNNILLKTEGKKLFFSATNLEIAITYFIDCDVRNEGAITVPSKLFSSYVSLIQGGEVEMNVKDGSTLHLNVGGDDTKIKGISSDEFPLIPKIEKEDSIEIEVKPFVEAIEQTVFSASLNTSRPVLSGVFFSVEKDELTMVATDSYRLSEKKLKLGYKGGSTFSCIVPGRTVSELGKILAKVKQKKLELSVSKNQILFKVGNIELTSRLIEGKFPDYEKIIPKDSKTKLTAKVEDLSLVVKRVSLFARENNYSIRMAATNDGKLTVSTDETRVGEEKAELDIKMKGDNNKVALNSQYLLDVLNCVGTEEVEIEMTDKLSPAVIKPCKKEGYTYIIMPLKI